MNFLVTLVAYLTIFPLSVWSANQNTSLFTNVIETDFEIATATTPFSLNYNPGGATPVYFYFFPCFGSFDLRIDSLNPSGTICSINWDSSSLYANLECTDVSSASKTYIVRISGINNYPNYPSAQFDILVVTNNSEFQNLVPTPGANGVINLLSLGGSGTQRTAQFQWTPTGNPNDTYTVYDYVGSTPSGAIFSTACGAKKIMTPRTEPIQDLNGMKTITLTGLDSQTRIITVVVSRPNGYSAAYGTFTLDGSNLQVPKYLIFAILVLFKILH